MALRRAVVSAALNFFGLFFSWLGILGFIVGWGLFNARKWAWVLTIVINALLGLVTAVQVYLGSVYGVVSLVLGAAVVGYFFTRPVLDDFGKRPWA